MRRGQQFRRSSHFGLLKHMHVSHRRKQGYVRWLIVTVVAGAFIALAFVNFLAR